MTYIPERGGSATQDGVYFQNCIAVLKMSAMLSGQELDMEVDRRPLGKIVSVRIEAPDDVDDVVVAYSTGAKEYIQAKTSITVGSKEWIKLWADCYRLYQRLSTQNNAGLDVITLAVRQSPTMQELKTLMVRAATSESVAEWLDERITEKQVSLLNSIREALDKPGVNIDDSALLLLCKTISVWLVNFEADPTGTDSFVNRVKQILHHTVKPLDTIFPLLKELASYTARSKATWTLEKLMGVLKENDYQIVEIPSLPLGLLRFEDHINTFPFVSPSGRSLPYTDADEKRWIFERQLLKDETSKLLKVGHILIAGSPQSGKSTLGTQLTKYAQNILASKYGRPQIYYCKASEITPKEVLDYFTGKGIVFLIIDEVQFGEKNAYELYSRWKMLWEKADRDTLHLIFISDWLGDEEERLEYNIFHEHSDNEGLVRSRFSEEEFKAFIKYLWENAKQEELPDYIYRKIKLNTKKSPALAMLAIGVAGGISFDGEMNEGQFRTGLLNSVIGRYSLRGFDDNISQACALTHYGIPIYPELFGTEQAEALIGKGFLVHTTTTRGYTVFSKAFSELWYKETHLNYDLDKLEDIFSAYLEGGYPHYESILSRLLKARSRRLLRSVVINRCYALLKDRIRKEKDLRKAAKALGSISEVDRKTARVFLEESLGYESLAARLQRGPDVSDLSKYLNTATRINRNIFNEESRLNRSIPLRITLQFLKELVRQPVAELRDIANLCQALARSNRDLARELVDTVVEVRKELKLSATNLDDDLRYEIFNFAGEISWFYPKRARRIMGAPTEQDLASFILRTHESRQVGQLIESIARLNNRKAISTIKELLENDGFDLWANLLVNQTTNLYDLGRAMEVIEQVNHNIGARFASRLLPFCRVAILNDSRLPAIGFFLSILRKMSHYVARETLDFVKVHFNLEEMFNNEESPRRFGRTVMAIANIDETDAADYLNTLGIDKWCELIEKADSLATIGLLLKSVTEAASNPDLIINKILGLPRVALKLELLSRNIEDARDPTYFVMTVSATCPLLYETKQRLLSFIKPEIFETVIRREPNVRRVAHALRAYSVAFPFQSQTFAGRLARYEGTEEAKKEDKEILNMLQRWVSVEDISERAHLLHAASEVDGRLGDRLGSLIDIDEACALLELEPKGTRTAEFIHALTLVESKKAQIITKRLFHSQEQAIEVFTSSRDSRELTKLLHAIHRSYAAHYKIWLATCLKNTTNREIVEREILLRCGEESHLDVLSDLIVLVDEIEQSLALKLIENLNYKWIDTAGRWDNHILQVFKFIRVVAQRLQNPQQGQLHLDILAQLRGMYYGNLELRSKQVRSLRTLGMFLVEALRISRAFNSPDMNLDAWEKLDKKVIASSLQYTDDLVGVGLISYLLRQFKEAPNTELISMEAGLAVRQKALRAHPIPALLALALIGAKEGDDETERVLEELNKLPGLKAWELGLSNWLAAQCAIMDGDNEAERLLVNKERLGILHMSAEEITKAIIEESGRARNNLRFAFVLAFAWQMQVNEDPAFITEIDDIAHARTRAEGRDWARKLLEEFSDGLKSLGSYLPQARRDAVPLLIRDLSPRIEVLAEPED